ncbi:hypothetical protein C8Q80DRAFT_1161072 [Daedaleopsis nitida]|nr:hypothetical protein C8Q80DRAFT_1161072 [Daedaleopsis nitida]
MLLDLNDDVLQLIFARLHGSFALNAALTCRRIHDYVIHRVAAVISCNNGRELPSLHRYLCAGTHPRAQYVEELSIYCHCFAPSNPSNPNGSLLLVPPDSNHARIVGDILVNARMLRKLALRPFDSLAILDARIIPSVASLSSTVEAELDGVGSLSIQSLRGTWSACLRNLLIRAELHDKINSLDPLLDLLRCSPNLSTLTLREFNVAAVAPASRSHTLHSFPAITHLRLSHVTVAVADIIPLCPNITDVRLYFLRPHTDYSITGQRWPPLRTLELEACQAPFLEDVLPPAVHCLKLYGKMTSYNTQNEHLAVLRQTSPVSLELRTDAAIDSTFWAAFAAAAPRLRDFTLYISRPLDDKYGDWVLAFPRMLRSLPLVALDMRLPRMERRPIALPSAVYACFEALPLRVADAIPTLKAFTLTATRPPTENDAQAPDARRQTQPVFSHDENGVEGPDPDAFETVLRTDGLGRQDIVRTWRIVHTEDGRVLESLTNRQAARLKRFLDDASLEDIQRIDEHLDEFSNHVAEGC